MRRLSICNELPQPERHLLTVRAKVREHWKSPLYTASISGTTGVPCGYMGGAGRPDDWDNRVDDDGLNRFQRHAAARVEYLERRRQAEMLDSQIQAIKELAS